MKGAAVEMNEEESGADADLDASADPEAGPELRLWLRLASCAAMIEGRLRARLRAEFGATAPRFDLLTLLDKAPDGLSMGEISRRLMVSNGNVTGLVERLAREDLVERFTVPGDRRTHLVRLTPAGRAACDAMARAYEGWLAELTTGLGRAEMTELTSLLDRLKRSVRGG